VLARIPGGNHDLAGDTIHGDFYIAGGQTAGWGYPARPHVFDEVFCLSGRNHQWTAAAKLSHPRFYNGTTAFHGELWVIAGNQRDEQGLAHFLSSVEIFNPRTGIVRPGPPLPFPLEMPVSACIGSRIYVAGGSDPTVLTATPGHTYRSPGKLLSIGAGETSWRVEPDAPFPLQAIAGTALQDAMYLAVPSIGLCSYNTVTRIWRSIHGPVKLRSPQITAYREDIWLLGGRDAADPLASYIYSPSKNEWSSGPRIPRELSWGAAGVINERLILAGGANGNSYNNRTFVYEPSS
jgi:N-acetylneuraminic acid mutarotase